jgi:signal transduction histidine kinase
MRLAVVLGAVLAGGAVARLVVPGDVAEDASLLSYQVVVCLVAVGLASSLLSRPWEHAAVADLVVDLGEARSDTLRDALSRALGDPTLDVGYWSREVEGFVDARGRELSLPSADDGRVSTVIEGGSGPLAVLIHHRALLDDPALVESVGAAARLASANARLQAEVRAQVAALDASRRRVVTVGDEEHRRLEARLRAGAERRMEALAARVASGRAALDDAAAKELLASVENQLAAALDELRSLAAGLHPRLLTEAGVSGALAALAARCPVPVRLVTNVERLPDPIEVAVYFVCSEALANVAKHAAATCADVTVETVDVRVTIEVADDGVGGADLGAGSGLRNLADRVEALGGTLHVTGGPSGGTRLVAELPLGDEIG